MKRYTIGLITGILLTASCVMFIGAKDNQRGRYVKYIVDRQNSIHSVLDTQTGIIHTLTIDSGMLNKTDILNGRVMTKVNGLKEWSEWKEFTQIK